MRMNLSRGAVAGVAAFATAITVGACGSSDEQSASSPTETTETTQTTTTGEQASHNQQDVAFAQHMIPHHEQAIEMSDIVLGKQGIDQRVVDMATQIRDAQGPEIETMQRWLQEWGVESMPGHGDMHGPGDMPHHSDMPGHGDMHGHGDMPMEGMLSPAEMDALRNAEGVEASRLFLEGMIRHHQGAIDMSQPELDSGQYQPAKDMAQEIIETQQREIDAMKEILESL